MYCHMCERLLESTPQDHADGHRHKALVLVNSRRMPGNRKWIRFCNGNHEPITPAMRALMATDEEILREFPDFLPFENDGIDGETPSYSPAEDYDDEPKDDSASEDVEEKQANILASEPDSHPFKSRKTE